MGTKLIFKNGKFEWADPNMVDKQTITPQATPTLGNQLAYVGGKFVAADADYYDSELGKIPDFIKQSASDFKNYGYSSSDDVYKGIVSGVDNYKRTIENAKKYNPGWYEKNKVDVDNVVKALDSVYNSYTNKKNTFGKYASEDEYNRDLYSYVYGDYTYDQIQREIAVLSGSQRRQSATESAKTQNKINVLKTLLYTNTYTDKDSYTKAIADIDKQISNINAELASIEPDVVYSGSRGEGPVRDYTEEQSNKLSELTHQRDYLKTTRAELEQKSKITDFTELPSKLGAANMAVFESNLDKYIHNPTGEEFKAVFEKMDTMPDGAEKDTLYYEGVPEIEDPVQFYLDNKDLIGENHQASSIGQYAIGLSVGETLGDLYWHARDFHWDQLKDEELLIYKFNLVKHGKEKALEYIRLLEPTLGQRYQAEVEKGFGDYMKEHGALAYIGLNALTVPMKMLGGVVGGMGLIDSYANGEANPYSQSNALRVGVNAIRSETGKAIEENTDFTIGGHNVLAEAYNIGMSTADSTFGALAFKQGYSFVAGLGAAADMAEDIYDRGGSSNQVFWGGVAAGVAETLFEYVSIDKLLDDSKAVDTAKKYFVNILVQAGVEASEEVFTEITNKIFDEMIMDEKSEFNQKVKQLVDSGMSLDEAREQAFTDVVYDVVWAGVAGFVSGGISSGGFGAVGYFSNSKNNAEIGKSIANNPFAIVQLAGYAQSLNDPAINKMLKGKPTDKNIGRIYNAVVENITNRFNNASNNNKVVDTYNDIINNTKLYPLVALANELAEKQTRKYSKLYEADLSYIQSMEEGSDSGQQNPGQHLKNSIDDNNDDSEDTEPESVLPKVSAAAPEADDIQDWAFKERGIERLTSDQKMLKEIGKAFGQEVKFGDLDRWVTTKKGKRRKQRINGFYDRSTGTIYLNTKSSANALITVFKHELTHFAENDSTAYTDFANGLMDSKAFKDWVASKGFKTEGDVSATLAMNADYRDRYGNSGLKGTEVFNDPVKGEHAANLEMVADFVAENLFSGDMSKLQEALSNVEPEAVNKFKQFLLNILNKIKNLFKKKVGGFETIQGIEAEFIKVCNAAQKAWEQKTVDNKKATTEGGVKYSFGVTQKNIDEYVNKAATKENTEDYKPYAMPTNSLIQALKNDIDISDYSHALRDNDIRHILNSHGEKTNEKYPVTLNDIKKIPNIVQNYDKVFYKTNASGKPGVVYVKVGENNIIYYVEAITEEYHNEKLLVNKQMVKTGINEIPNLYGLIDAINKKQSSSQYLADLEKIRKAYVQDVKENYSNNNIPNLDENVKQNLSPDSEGVTENADGVPESKPYSLPDEDGQYMRYAKSWNTEAAQQMVDEAAKNAGAILDESGNPLKLYRGTKGGQTVFEKENTLNGKIYTIDNVEVATKYGDKSGKATEISNQVEGEPTTYALYGFPKKMLTLDAQYGVWSDLLIPEELLKYSDGRYKATNAEIAEWAETEGYDALRINNVRDGSFDVGSEIIFFEENLVKSADAITKDKNGDIIPLSERFNDAETDIRYSLPDNRSDLLQRFKDGEITEEEFAEAWDNKPSKENPISIANLKPEDANTTPEKKRKKGENKGNKESNLYESIQTSDIFNDSFKKTAKDDSYIKTYQSITNKETLNKAFKELEEGGQQYVNKWFNKPVDEASLVDITVGLILMDRYQRIGDYESAMAATERVREMGTASGRQVQIFSIIGRFTPDMMIKYAQKELAKAFELMVDAKTKRWGETHQDIFKLTADEIETIRRKTLQAAIMPDGSRTKAILLAEICTMLQDKIPPDAGTSIRAWQRISMLLNFKTNIRNIVGNLGMVPIYIASDYWGSVGDWALSKLTGVRTTGVSGVVGNLLTSQGRQHLKKVVKAFGKGIYETYDDFKRGIHTKQEELNRYAIEDFGMVKSDGVFKKKAVIHQGITSGGKSFNEQTQYKLVNAIAKKLNALDNFTSFCLELGDRPFFEMWFMNSLNNQLRLNKTETPTPEMVDIATEEALQRTWQDNNTMTRAVSKIKQAANSLPLHIPLTNYGLGDMLIKFTKTPANIAKAIVDFSPIGLVTAGYKAAQLVKKYKGGSFTPQMQKDVVRTMSNAITGTMFYALVIMGASLGYITFTGDADDDKDVANFEKYIAGVPPYSIEIFGVNVTYDWFQPFGSTLAIAAEFMENQEDPTTGIGEDMWNAFLAAGEVFTQQSFLKSLYEFFSSADENILTGLADLALSDPSTNIPTFLSQVASFFDEDRRSTYDSNSLKNLWNQIRQKLPAVRNQLPEQVNTFGETVENNQYMNVWRAFFSPYNDYPESSGKVADKVYDLYKETGNKSVMPRVAPYKITVKGQTYNFTVEQRNDFQREMGNTSVDMLDKAFKSKEFKQLSDEEKVKVINKIYDYATKQAKIDFLASNYDYELLASLSGENDDGDPILTKEMYKKMNSKAKKHIIEDYFLSKNEMGFKSLDDAVDYYITKAKE